MILAAAIPNNHLAPPQSDRARKSEHNQLHLGARGCLQLRRMKFALTSLLLLAGGLGGCSTNPITGRSQLVGLVSEGEAIQGSAKAYQQMMADLDKKQKLDKSGEKDSPHAQQIQQISDRLIAQAIKFRPDSASWRWE